MLTLIAIAGVALLWQVVALRLYRDPLAPLSILGLSWMLPLSLGWLDLSIYEAPWAASTIAAMAWVTASMVGACLLPRLLVGDAHSFEPHRAEFIAALAVLRTRRVRIFLVALFVVVFACYLYAEFVTSPIGIPALRILAGDRLTGEFHRWGKETRWAIITPTLFVLCPVLYLAGRQAESRGWRWLLIGLTLLYPLFGLLKLSRSDIFVSALNLGATEYYLRRFAPPRPLEVRRLVATAAAVTVALLAAGVVLQATLAARLGSRSSNDDYANAIGFIPRGDNGLYGAAAQAYGYLALPFENFRRAFEHTDGGFHPGTSTLRPLFSAAGQGRVADDMLSTIVIPDPVSSAAGSSTFLTPIYMELGMAGLLLVPLAYALLVNVLYVRFRSRPSLLTYLAYLNFLYPWTWLYFNNAFSVLTFYLNAVFILALVWVTLTILPRLRW
jgi:hypothetical protein